MARKDAFAKKMDAVEQMAKRQGARTKRERVMFVTGYMFGTADMMTDFDLIKRKKKQSGRANAKNG